MLYLPPCVTFSDNLDALQVHMLMLIMLCLWCRNLLLQRHNRMQKFHLLLFYDWNLFLVEYPALIATYPVMKEQVRFPLLKRTDIWGLQTNLLGCTLNTLVIAGTIFEADKKIK